MLGLKRGVVKLLPYNSKWKLAFEKEKRQLEKILGNRAMAIEHVGSTAIPGMSAKPIIDILVGVRTLKREGRECVGALEKCRDYHYRKITKLRFLVVKGSNHRRTHYIHIARYKGGRWRKLIVFRDYLRSHHEAAQEYDLLKRELEERYNSNRKLYTGKKNEYVKKILSLVSNSNRG